MRGISMNKIFSTLSLSSCLKKEERIDLLRLQGMNQDQK